MINGFDVPIFQLVTVKAITAHQQSPVIVTFHGIGDPESSGIQIYFRYRQRAQVLAITTCNNCSR
jgi:hypothetical protein